LVVKNLDVTFHDYILKLASNSEFQNEILLSITKFKKEDVPPISDIDRVLSEIGDNMKLLQILRSAKDAAETEWSELV
jgi:hypothetical protein